MSARGGLRVYLQNECGRIKRDDYRLVPQSSCLGLEVLDRAILVLGPSPLFSQTKREI